jgi:hypothetical protein
VFRAVEFAGYEAAVPGEDSFGFGDTGHLLECCATEPLADLGKGGSLGIGKPHTSRKVRPEDPIFGDQILILQQEFLIDQAGDVRQEPSPFVVWHEEDPS